MGKERSAVMRTLTPFVVVALTVAMAACGPKRGVATVEWRDHGFHEVTSLTDLPPAIRSQLEREPGSEGIADRGGCFNPTDVVSETEAHTTCPTRRFVVAGRGEGRWLVALEKGGRGYHVEVLLFSSPRAAADEKWVLFHPPATLKEVVDRISKQEVSKLGARP
jgi:hypothetical protein